MPQPITHYLIIQRSLEKTTPSIWRQYSNYAVFGSFGPDLFSVKGAQYFWTDQYKYREISDIMHWDGSLDFFCAMLDVIKHKKLLNAPAQVISKLKAFAYGYASHIITDIVFHPFVFRAAKDHWYLRNNKKAILKHKKIESIIDSFLLKKFEKINPYDFAYPAKVNCSERENSRELDREIFELLNFSLNRAYEKPVNKTYRNFVSRDYHGYFGRFPSEAPAHPTREAYQDFLFLMHWLYNKKVLSYIPVELVRSFIPKKKLKSKHIYRMNHHRKNWYKVKGGQKLNFSVEQLFDFSLRGTVQVTEASEHFLKTSNNMASRAFFAEHYPDFEYLNHNYNLDNGLKSEYNFSRDNISENPDLLFSFKLGELYRNFKRLKKLKIPGIRHEQKIPEKPTLTICC